MIINSTNTRRSPITPPSLRLAPSLRPQVLVEREAFRLRQLTEKDSTELVLEVREGSALPRQGVRNRVEGALSRRDHHRALVHLHHLCSHSEGTDRNHVDLILVLQLEPLRVEIDCALGGAVDSQASREEDPSARSDVDDGASLLSRPHLREQNPIDLEESQEIDIHILYNVMRIDLQIRPTCDRAGIIDHNPDVQPLPLL